MVTPRDFDFLKDTIFERLHQNISSTTLKRLWGYVPGIGIPRMTTLNILSQLVGSDSWDDFCQKTDAAARTASPETGEPADTGHSVEASPRSFRWLWVSLVAFVLILFSILIVSLRSSHAEGSSASSCVLRQGQHFATPQDYLRLFGISDMSNYWGKVLPHHPDVVVWGPEYAHPHWHNSGERDQMMPTITERWEPADADSTLVVMRNRDKYHHELRLNEVRITFMKNLVDTGYVFLGVYRLSLAQSDTTRCVWERIADNCDLSNLAYLEELRN